MAKSIAIRTVQLAASAVGGARKLRDLLDVRTEDLMSWLCGASEPPRPVFLQSLDLILDNLEKDEDSERATRKPDG